MIWQEVALCEVRRRELEFLEKGGNPLDFTFGDTSAVNICFLLPTNTLAEQNLTSETEGRFCLAALPNGESGENDEQCRALLGRGSNTGNSHLPFSGDIEALDSEGNHTGQSDGGQVDIHRRESEDSCSVWVKKQAYTRRNRSKSTNFNAHSSLRDTSKYGAADGSSAVSTGMKGIAEIKEAEAVTLAEKNNNISLISVAKAISLYRTGLPKASSCKEHMGSDSDQLQRKIVFGQMGKTSTEDNGSIIKDVDTEQVRKQEHPKALDHPVVSPNTSVATAAGGKMDNQSLHLVDGSMDVNKCVAIMQEEVHKNLNDGYFCSRNGSEKFSLIEPKCIHPKFHNPKTIVGNLIVSETNSVNMQERNGDETIDNARISITGLAPTSITMCMEKELTLLSNTSPCRSMRADSILEDKNTHPTDGKVKIEQAISDGEKFTCITSTRELKVNSRSGGISTFQNGTTCSVARVSSSSGASSSNNPSNVSPWDKDKIKDVVAERHNADLKAAAKKAHEDLILEEAEGKKAVLKRNAEWTRRRPFVELPRRKSHWDFVLEEVSWMANDFMQERLWKMKAAAQICQWVARGRGQLDLRVRKLQQKQKQVARVLSKAVTEFWQSVEVLVCKKNHVVNLHPDICTSSQKQNPSDGEAVPMEIDKSTITEMHKKELEAGSMSGMRRKPIHEYAICFITDTKKIGGLIQSKAPIAIDIEFDARMLEPLREDQFQEESLFYSVPCGAMEAYRNSVEIYWSSAENPEHTTALVDTDAGVGSEAGDEALGCLECGMSSVVDYACRGHSPQRRGLYGYGDKRIHYLADTFDDTRGALFASKKRKNIMKACVPKNYDTKIPQQICHPFSLGNNAESGSVGLLTLVPGKRSSSNLNVGVIPMKRVRSCTNVARCAVGTPNSATVAPSGLGNKAHISSGDTSSQHEAFSTPGAVSKIQKMREFDLTEACGNHVIYDGTDMSFKLKKKKKSKPFGAVISSITRDIGGISRPSGKDSKSEQMWHQDTISQHEQREQTKRKGDSNSRVCDTRLGTLGTASELEPSNSHEMLGQHAAKKPKLSKHLSDFSAGITTPSTNCTLSPRSFQMSNMSSVNNKIVRQIACRERGRKTKPAKAASSHIGTGIPWSTVEDQALLVLVHDVGTNWELISDIINSSLQIKGIFRKPLDCKERHKYLMDRTTEDGCYSPEDSDSSQPYPSNLAGIPKGSARLLLQRLQGPMQEDTLKTYLEKIVQIGQQHRGRKVQNYSQEPKQCAQVHPSHLIAISQICSKSSSGQILTPLDLRDEVPSKAEVLTHAYQLQAPVASDLVMPSILGTAVGIQPTSPGITFLQRAKIGVQLGTGLVASSLGLNGGGSGRGLQRYSSTRSLSVSMDQQQQLLEQYNRIVAGRSLAMSANISIMGLPSSNDCGISMPIADNGTGIISGHSRGMPLSRAGFPGTGSIGIPGIVSSGIDNMLPSSGIGLPMSVPVPSGSMHFPGDMIHMPRDTQVLQPGQDQRQMFMQELQLESSQSNGQAPAPFTTVHNTFSDMVSSANHNFSSQHGHQKPQLTEVHGNQLYAQSHVENHDQAYMQAVHQLHHQRQHQQHHHQRQIQQQQHSLYLQSQHQFPANSSLLFQLPQSRPLPFSHMEHSMSSQPHHLSQVQQQQPVLPQNVLQQELTSQSSPMLQQAAIQQSSASPVNPPLLQSSQQQHLILPHMPGQGSQAAGQSKSHYQNQIQKQRQPQAKMSKGFGREAVLSQNMSSHPAQGNGLSSVPENLHMMQLQAQVMHSVPEQRLFPGTSMLQLGKKMSQLAGKEGQFHGQGPELEHINMSHITKTACQQQQGFSQQSFSQQISPLIPQQHRPSILESNHQVLLSSPSSVQQLQAPGTKQPTSSAPVLLPSSSEQQQRAIQSQQTVQCRLPQLLVGSYVGSEASQQLCKDSLPQENQATSQSGHAALQPGSNTSHPLTVVYNNIVAPVSSTLISGATTVHSSACNPGQNTCHVTGGIYNLSRNNAASTSEILLAASLSGTSVSLSNGNTATSTTASTDIVLQGVDIAGASQPHFSSLIGPVHEQNAGNIPAIDGKAMQQVGAEQSTQHQQLYEHQH